MSSDDYVVIAHNPNAEGFIVVHLFGEQSTERMIQGGFYQSGFPTPGHAITAAMTLHTEYGITFTPGVIENIVSTYEQLNTIITGNKDGR